VLLTVTHALEKSRLRQQQQELLTAAEHRYQMIGESAAMKRVWADIEKVAPTNARVLITGESGTGKELVAFWLHKLSPRKDERLVKINCAAIPRELIESEMFGYEKGAFTGAAQRRQGKFEVADKGTFFLDEIGEMDAFAQTKLLRVLEDGEFTRVGGVTPTKVDVRVISATNKDIKAAVEKGEFRSDLFHRLDVFEIRLPPLRARAEDIPVLARYFLDEYCRDNGLAPKKLIESGTSFLSSLKLPGNIRELRNLIERAVIISSGPEIGVEDFQPSLTPDIQFPTSDADDFRRARDLHVAKEELESKYIETQLKLNGWSITRTAQRLGIERSNLSRRMKQLGIEKPDFYLHPPITTD
jgi:DNA-binding NtrC family response regulator